MAFLTTFTDNAPAIATYEALGYRIRRPMHVMFARRPAAAA
jgi:ribosomal protein S18 acetylase RimI-like enzyme